MAFALDSKFWKRIAAPVFAIAATSTLVWFGNGMEPWWPLLWLAPLPVLLYVVRSSWSAAATTATVAWFLGILSLWHYFTVLHMPLQVRATIFATMALGFTASVLLYRAPLRRGYAWSALVAFPAAWVSGEFLHNLTTPDGTAGSLAYSQLRFLPFLQLASITGPWGMSFLLLLFPAALAIGLHLRTTAPQKAIRIVGASLGLIALVLIFGAVRLAHTSPGPQVTVGLIASDTPANSGVSSEGAKTQRLFHEYAAEAEKLIARGAQVVVIPENLGIVADPNTGDADRIFQSLADKTSATIIAGMTHISAPISHNQARIYTPNAPVLSYDKHHLLPPFELKFQPGTSIAVLPKSNQTWGVAICKDMDFTPLSRQYGNAGVGLMFVPAWDFNIDRSWHGHIAIMRGVESGFSIAHAARDGYLTVTDDRGRILAETRTDSAPFATLLAQVPAVHDSTIYLKLGDWFGWLAIAILVLMLAQLFLSGKKTSEQS
jgi:apolipoprotein N-acyltransferase